MNINLSKFIYEIRDFDKQIYEKPELLYLGFINF